MLASGSHVDCSLAKCDRSHNGIPYLKLQHFAQSLLDKQNYADLEDLVDGMDLCEAWGEENLQLDHVPIEYINRKNELIYETLPGLQGVLVSLSTAADARRAWKRVVYGKRARLIPKYSYADKLYLTRFHLIGSLDPRLDTERQV
jgi:hypothetical protein